MMRGLTGVNAGPQGWLRHIVLRRRSSGVGPADDRAVMSLPSDAIASLN